jgi:hypothetical protein
MKERDEHKMLFHMSYDQFEYQVIPFGLTNAPASFQAYTDYCVRPYLDDFTVYYLDDILIYSRTAEEHEQRVKQILIRLRKYRLLCKASKCTFGVKEVGFLGFMISPDGVGMECDRMATMEDWPTPGSSNDV